MMTRAIAVCVFVVAIGSAAAQSDTIGLYADFAGSDCNIVDNTRGLLNIYVVHISPAGTQASQFSAPKPACMTGAIWWSDVWPFFGAGNTQIGASTGYGSCRTGLIHVVTMQYFVQGGSESCCFYPLLPDPDPSTGGNVRVVDCDGNTVAATGLVATVNGNATCPCGYPVPVEETTWGQVKALYTE